MTREVARSVWRKPSPSVITARRMAATHFNPVRDQLDNLATLMWLSGDAPDSLAHALSNTPFDKESRREQMAPFVKMASPLTKRVWS